MGDERAWDRLVGRLEPVVRRVAAGFRLADADADDVIQRTWMQLLISIDKVNDPLSLPGWVATTARRLCLELYQRRTREIPMEVIEVRGTDPSTEGLAIVAERRRIVRRAVAGLPARQRNLVTLMLQCPDRPYCGARGCPRDADRQHRADLRPVRHAASRTQRARGAPRLVGRWRGGQGSAISVTSLAAAHFSPAFLAITSCQVIR